MIRSDPKPQDDAALQKEADDQLDVVRLLGLNILSTALETLGTRVLDVPPLLSFCRRTLCQTIISASQAENLFVVSFVMRLVCWLCSTMREHLKMQIEIMIREVLLRIISDRTASDEAPYKAHLNLDHKRQNAFETPKFDTNSDSRHAKSCSRQWLSSRHTLPSFQSSM